jgi:4-amino-4-deoxy-L-arabinose transferase-like glycosyltransferase
MAHTCSEVSILSDEIEKPASAKWVLYTLLALVILRLFVAASLPLAADEAYYWSWSENLGLGYYDHPPGIAYLIALSGVVFGEGELGVRGAGIVLHSAVVWGLIRTFPRANSWLMLLLLVGAPLFLIGGLLATPDSPLLIGWALAIIGAKRDDWRILGMGVAVAILSKMTGLLLLLAVMIVYRKRASWLTKVAILQVVVLSPHFIWSIGQGGAPYLFQLEHGLGGGFGFLGLGEAYAGQLLMVGPFLVFATVRWFAEREPLMGERSNQLLIIGAAITFLAYSISAAFGTSEINWVAPAWLSALVGLTMVSERRSRLVWVGGLTHGILGGFLLAQALGPLWTFPKGPTDRFYYGQSIGERVAEWQLPVVASHYQFAALAQFYGGVPATTIPEFWRADQYDISRTSLPEEALLVLPMNQEEAVLYASQWYSLEELESIRAWRGERKIGEWALYRGALLEEVLRSDDVPEPHEPSDGTLQ